MAILAQASTESRYIKSTHEELVVPISESLSRAVGLLIKLRGYLRRILR
jgi:hypothetical protein